MKKIFIVVFACSCMQANAQKNFRNPCSNSDEKKVSFGVLMSYTYKYSETIEMGIKLKNFPLSIMVGSELIADTSLTDLSRKMTGWRFLMPVATVGYRFFLTSSEKISLTPYATYGFGKKEYQNFFKAGARIGAALNDEFEIFLGPAAYKDKLRIEAGLSFIFD